MKYSKKISNKLKEILEKNHDAEAGYSAAAKMASNINLKKFFTERAQNRFVFGHELIDEIKFYGKEVYNGYGRKENNHRNWMDLKSTLSNNNDEAILKEAIRGEKIAIEDYNAILKGTILASSTKKVLEEQYHSVISAFEKVKTLEDLA